MKTSLAGKILQTLKSLNHNGRFIAFNAVLAFVLLNVVASRAYVQWDLTRDQVNSLSQSSYQVFDELKQNVIVEAYISGDVPGEIKAVLDPIVSQLQQMDRVGGDRLSVRIYDPTTEELKDRAVSRGITGQPVGQATMEEASVRQGYFGIYLQSGERSALLELARGGALIENFEYVFLRKLKDLTEDPGPSGIGFYNAPGTSQTYRPRSLEEYGKDNLHWFRMLAENDMGSWKDVFSGEPVPEDVETLIVAGLPRLDSLDRYFLDQFLLRGGNLILLATPFEFRLSGGSPMAQMGLGQSRAGPARISEELQSFNDWISSYGIKIRPEILFEPVLAAPELDLQGQYMVEYRNPAWAVYSHQSNNLNEENPLTSDAVQIIFPWTGSLEILPDKQPQAKFTTLVESSADAIVSESHSLALEEMQDIGRSTGDEYVSSPRPMMALAEGNFFSAFKEKQKEEILAKADPASRARLQELLQNSLAVQKDGTRSRILVAPTSYMVADIFLTNESNARIFQVNLAFLSSVLESMQGDTDLVAARLRTRGVDYIEGPPSWFSYLIPSDKGFQVVFQWFHVLLVPLIVGIYGLIRLTRRNQKRGMEDG
ncbi:MAG: Gldg family protein [Leptospiraceae bacterium]|nr:Gldg family protein [Leptospiraceae bacterium]